MPHKRRVAKGRKAALLRRLGALDRLKKQETLYASASTGYDKRQLLRIELQRNILQHRISIG